MLPSFRSLFLGTSAAPKHEAATVTPWVPAPQDVQAWQAREKQWRGHFAKLGLTYLKTSTSQHLDVNDRELVTNVGRNMASSSAYSSLYPRLRRLGRATVVEQWSELIKRGALPDVSLVEINSQVGRGVFANTKLPSASLVGEYTGELKYAVPCTPQQSAYLFNLWPTSTDSPCVDALRAGNHTRFINHSADPNVGIVFSFFEGQWHLLMATLREVAAGEQLFVDYGRSYWGANKPAELARTLPRAETCAQSATT